MKRKLSPLPYEAGELFKEKSECCCCFSHSAHWLPTRKKLLYTVANPARGLLNREKNIYVWQRPPPARCSFGGKNHRRVPADQAIPTQHPGAVRGQKQNQPYVLDSISTRPYYAPDATTERYGIKTKIKMDTKNAFRFFYRTTKYYRNTL